MRTFFTSAAHQKEYEKRGFIKVDLFNEDSLMALRTICEKFAWDNNGFVSSFFSTDANLKREIFANLWPIFQPAVERIFVNFRPLIGTILVKNAGENSGIGHHQDWSFVDEKVYRSFNIWFPLSETHKNNGALHLVPGSHHFGQNPRTITEIFPCQDEHHKKFVEKYAELVTTTPGQAIIMDSKIVHYSLPNYDENPRTVAGMVVVPAEAPSQIYVNNKEGHHDLLDVRHADEKVFIETPMLELGTRTTVISQHPFSITKDPYKELQSLLEPSWAQKIRRRFAK